MAVHGVVRTDLMSGTDQRADMVSLKYKVGGTPTAIDNGCVLKIGALVVGEREVFEGLDMDGTTGIDQLALVATPEVMYDERLVDFADFYNEADTISRGYRLRAGNIFSVTKEVLGGLATPNVGNFVNASAGNKLEVVAASGTSTIGEIIQIELVGTRTYYVIQLV